jgi:hypothetical protein
VWLDAAGQVIPLQSSTQLGTHLSLRSTKAWACDVSGHAIEIARVKPRLAAAFRKCRYTITIDGIQTHEFMGY